MLDKKLYLQVLDDEINKPYLEDSGLLDYIETVIGLDTIIYALSNVFNFKTDIYFNHGDKIWNLEGGPKRSLGNPPSTLMTDVVNPDLKRIYFKY